MSSAAGGADGSGGGALGSPVAVVTGAGRGIGRAVGLELARRGYSLRVVSRSGDQLASVVQEATTMNAAAGPHRSAVCDLTRPADITSLADGIMRDDGRVDLLVLNAGTAVRASLEETTLEEWDRVFALNVRSPFLLAKAFLPLLRRGPGRIVVIGSVVSVKSYAGQGAYVASKHALYGFTQVLAKELHEEGIVVQTVLPGGVATEMVRTMRPDIDTTDLIQPEDVAHAVGSLLEQDGNAVVDEIRVRRRGKTPWA